MNKNFELTLLSESEGQVWSNNEEEQLDVLKKYGAKAAVTDLCILTGSYSIKSLRYTTDENSNSLKARIGRYWTKSNTANNDVCLIFDGYAKTHITGDAREFAIRPIIQSNVLFSKLYQNSIKGYNNTFEIEFGEYPQWAVSLEMQCLLEKIYETGKLNKTGRSYTFDSAKLYDPKVKFKPITYDEYEYQGKKYIRVIANSYFSEYECKLSNESPYKNGDCVWVEVSPVRWLVDEKTQTLISKYGLLSGIRFLDKDHEYNGDFSKTEMYEYLNKYMIKDLFQNVNCIQKGSDNNIEESLNILGLGSCKGISQEILNLIVKDRINQVITDSKLYDSMDYKLLKEQINKILEAGKSISLHVNNISNKVKKLNSK